MKKFILFFISNHFIDIFYNIYLTDSQNKLTLKIKSLYQKKRYFIKNTINSYLYNFDINLNLLK